jgi:hypothetical protein
VPYERIHGIKEPKTLTPLANDGKLSKHLPEGTPFGLVGTSSLYKRESYPYGAVKPGTVTATFAGEKDPTGHRGFDSSFNWSMQGSDAGLYQNADIHAVRIVQLEPASETNRGRTFYNHARERMRILGEIPLRKFDADGKEPLDPDGNPDTSFLARIPADVAWTFQTLDRRGMVLNAAQTWHQLRPGEVRTDCGGCHAHSQQPTDFKRTAAAKPDYTPFDLTRKTSLVTTRAADESKGKWDARGETGIRYESGPKTVEYHRDVKPILARSCVACHTEKDGAEPAGKLVLDDDRPVKGLNPASHGGEYTVPGTYARLALDPQGKWGHPPLHQHKWAHLPNAASRYVTMMQARRSLLIWKVYGERLDGWQNDDMPYEAVPGDPKSLRHKGAPVPDTNKNRETAHIGYTGGPMPPPEAVAAGKVQGLSDEDRLTLARWVDLGCPIDLTRDAKQPDAPLRGWAIDDQRPTLALALPKAGANATFDRVLVGMHDTGSGLDAASFSATADFAIDGVAAGAELATKFRALPDGRWELKLDTPLTRLPRGTLTVSVRDRQGHTTRVERTFSVPVR